MISGTVFPAFRNFFTFLIVSETTRGLGRVTGGVLGEGPPSAPFSSLFCNGFPRALGELSTPMSTPASSVSVSESGKCRKTGAGDGDRTHDP